MPTHKTAHLQTAQADKTEVCKRAVFFADTRQQNCIFVELKTALNAN